MTTRRVILDANAASPMRVSAAGVDASGATWENLIFDANQPPMRVYLNGWMRVPWIVYGAANLANWAYGPSYPATPPGTFPLFLTMWWQPSSETVTASPGRTPYGTTVSWNVNSTTNGRGAGAAVGGGVLTGITFVHSFILPSGDAYSWPDQTHISYCIFRNYA